MAIKTEKLMGNFLENIKTSTLPTMMGFDGFQNTFIRTTLYPLQTPLNTAFQPLWETFEKLNKTEKLLKKLSLYNTKYLLLSALLLYPLQYLSNELLKLAVEKSQKVIY